MPAEDAPVARNLDDADHPACTMGRAADVLGTTPALLLVDQGTPIEAACRIIPLEDRPADALRLNRDLRREPDERGPDIWSGRCRNAGGCWRRINTRRRNHTGANARAVLA